MAAMLRLVGVADDLDGHEEIEPTPVDPEPAVIAVLSEDEFRRVLARFAREQRAEAA